MLFSGNCGADESPSSAKTKAVHRRTREPVFLLPQAEAEHKKYSLFALGAGILVALTIVLSNSRLSAKRHGALIVFEQTDNLDDYLQGGVIIDAVVSAPLLEGIFYPGSQLHDGAVFIRNRRVMKAGCLLPFAPTAYGLGSLGLGTRHQAALRLSQVSDALVIVVSEEKGWISLALRGQLFPNIGTSALLQKLGKP